MRIGNWACRGAAAVLISLATILFAPPIAYAQDPTAFYKGRNVDLYIGYSVGGAYDLYARVLAQSLGEALPSDFVSVERDRSMSERMRGRPGEVSRVEIRLGDQVMTLAVKNGRPVAEICREVRGVVLSRQPVPIQQADFVKFAQALRATGLAEYNAAKTQEGVLSASLIWNQNIQLSPLRGSL